jgi:hypothetical protein
MATIKISPDFFTKEILNYSDWQSAFWRELFQNSIDAGAKNIDIQTEDSRDNVIVNFKDDGKGMDKKTLEEVFFNLGSTTKTNEDSVGGFGKARIILCFAQTEYMIRTNKLFVRGSGADYELEEDYSYVKGCEFLITVPVKKFFSNSEQFSNSLKTFLSRCNLNCKVTINGIAWNSWTKQRGKNRDLEFAKAIAIKDGEKNRILFRVNGLCMFTRYTHYPDMVIVEIKPNISRNILLSNRDSINYYYSDKVDDFINSLSNDSLTAFRSDEVENIIITGKSRKFKSKRSQLPKSTNYDAIDYNPFAAPRLECNFQSVDNEDDDEDDDGLIIVTKTNDAKIKRASRSFKPDNLEDTSRKKKLLNQWIIACEYALESYCQITANEEISWRPGLVFDKEIEACHQKQNDNSHALMLNPIFCSGENLGKIKFSLNNFGDHVKLLTLAAHEVAHCSRSYHDETYANLFTEIVADLMQNVNKASKEMKLA